jgi:hypothetical protein
VAADQVKLVSQEGAEEEQDQLLLQEVEGLVHKAAMVAIQTVHQH